MDQSWRPPPEPLALPATEVHVWLGGLDQSLSEREALASILSSDELERANRFRFETDRGHFIAGRGILRTLLGRYLECSPESIAFDYGRFGKPELRRHSGLRFNLSHSNGLAVFAFVRERRVGIDIEFIRPSFAEEEIAQRFFAPAEVRRLLSLPPESRARGFFDCWTRKEAFIKALGEGLSYPLDGFTVSLAPGEPVRLLSVETDPGEAGKWRMWDLPAPPGYSACVIAEGPDLELKCWR